MFSTDTWINVAISTVERNVHELVSPDDGLDMLNAMRADYRHAEINPWGVILWNDITGFVRFEAQDTLTIKGLQDLLEQPLPVRRQPKLPPPIRHHIEAAA